MNVATKRLAGRALRFLSPANCWRHAAFHHRDPVGERIGLRLVMSDEDRRHPVLVEQVLDAAAQHRAQLRLELAHRLVEQIEVGAAHQRAGQRGALLLAARDRGRITLEDRFDLDERRDLGDAPLALLARHPRALQREADVLAHRQRRIERIALEGHGDVAGRGRQAVDDPAAEVDGAGGGFLETGDHAQRRCLAAARGAEKRDDLALVHRHIERLHRMHRRLAAPGIDLVDILDGKGRRHVRPSRPRPAPRPSPSPARPGGRSARRSQRRRAGYARG